MHKSIYALALAVSIPVGLALGAYDQSTNIRSGGTLPTGCRTGDLYVKTGTSAGLYSCISNVWTGPYSATGGTGAPDDATYITQTANGSLSAEQAIGALSSGILRGAATTGVITSLGDDLPFANFVQASAASKLIGRGSASGAGDFQEISLGSGLSMSGTTLSVSGAPLGDAIDFQIIRKTGDEQVSNSTALQSDNELVFPIGASETWKITFVLSYDGSISGDIKVALNVPTSATGLWWGNNLATGAGSNSGDMTTFSTTDLTDTGAGAYGAGGTTFRGAFYMTAYVINSTNAGNVTLRWAQNSTNGTATTVYTGSIVYGFRVN